MAFGFFQGFPLAQDSKNPASHFLKKSLQNYTVESFEIPIKQETFLSIIKTSLKSEGSLFVSKEKFRLELKGNPSSLSVFDGKNLWYQPDKKEKLVFKLKQSFQNLNRFFNYEDLLKNFEIKDFKNQKTSHIYQLQPKKNSVLESVYLKTDTKSIREIRLRWKNANNWQRYYLSPPLIKKQNKEDKLFVFPSAGFKIIEKTEI